MVMFRVFYFIFYIFTVRSKLRKVLFLAPSVTFSFILFMHQISRQRMRAKLVPRSDEFECQGQRSGTKPGKLLRHPIDSAL